MSTGALLLPLALAQFLASYNTSAMSVALTSIANDLGATVTGVQAAISLFTLTMAALMITGSKLTDIWGRRRCFVAGIWVFGIGALIAALSPGIGALIAGFSLLQGVGSALMIPPIYILLTVSFDSVKERAKAFGVISAMAGLGSAAGPLIGGTITTVISWRASFAAEVLVIAYIWWLTRRLHERQGAREKHSLDLWGAVLSAAALASIVIGILQANSYGWITARKDFTVGDTVVLSQGSISPVWLFVGFGLLLMLWFVVHIVRRERHGKEPLIHARLFKNRTSDLGLVTQLSQWFLIQGGMFLVAVFLQVSLEYSAVKTGLLLTPATIGILLSAAAAPRLARRFSQRALIRGGFAIALAGIGLLLWLGDANSTAWLLAPGLFTLGLGLGVTLTASTNVVQSSVPDADQGEISGVSRSASNLGSSLGVAVAGAVLIAGLIASASSQVNQSSAFSSQQKQQLDAALEKQVSALNDAQVQSALQGQPPAVANDVTSIYNSARNEALGYALIVVGVVGALGLLAALGLPAPPKEDRSAEAAHAPRSPGARQQDR